MSLSESGLVETTAFIFISAKYLLFSPELCWVVLELHTGQLDLHFLPMKYVHRFEFMQLNSSPFIPLTFQPSSFTETRKKPSKIAKPDPASIP